MPMTMDTVVVQSKDLVEADVGDQTVMMSIERGKYYALDSIATQIWELIASPRSIREICDQILPKYDIDRAAGEQDVLAFVQDLQKSHVIQLQDG